MAVWLHAGTRNFRKPELHSRPYLVIVPVLFNQGQQICRRFFCCNIWCRQRQDFDGSPSLIIYGLQRSENLMKVQMPSAWIMTVRVGKMDVSNIGSMLYQAVSHPCLFDVHMKHIRHKPDILEGNRPDQIRSLIYRVDEIDLVSIYRLDNQVTDCFSAYAQTGINALANCDFVCSSDRPWATYPLARPILTAQP